MCNSQKDNEIVQTLSQNISQKVVNTLLKWFKEDATEGLEEVFTDIVNKVAQKLTYADKMTWEKVFSTEDAWDSFLSGLLLSRGMNGADAIIVNSNAFQNAGLEDIAGKLSRGEALSAAEQQRLLEAVLKNTAPGTAADSNQSSRVTEPGKFGMTGWDGRVAVTEATGPNVTVDGKTYALIGKDVNGSPVYQDVEVLQEQAAEETVSTGKENATQTEKDGSASAAENEQLTQDLEQGERENSKNLYEATVVSPTVKTAQYRRLYNNLEESVKIQRYAYQCAKEMLQHRSGTKFENLTYINTVTGEQLTRSDYEVENQVIPSKKMMEMVRKSEPYTVIALHNHPGSSVPSMADIHSAYVQKYKYGLIVCHNGVLMRYCVTGESNYVVVPPLLDKAQKYLYNNDEKALQRVLAELKEENIILEVFK